MSPMRHISVSKQAKGGATEKSKIQVGTQV